MDNGKWITVNHRHIFIPDGVPKEKAIREFFNFDEDLDSSSESSVMVADDILKESSNQVTDNEKMNSIIREFHEDAPEDVEVIFEIALENGLKGATLVSESERKKASYYSHQDHLIHLKPYELEKGFWDDKDRWQGSGYFHESGHAIDALFSKEFYNRSGSGYFENYLSLSYYNVYVSSGYITEATGMSLNDTLKKELRAISESDIQDMIHQRRTSYVLEELKNNGFTQEDLDTYSVGVREAKEAMKNDPDWQYSVDSYKRYKYYSVEEFERDQWNYIKKFLRNNPKYEKVRDLDFSKIVSNSRNNFYRDYLVVSDVISSRWYSSKEYGSKGSGLGVFGHGETYYQKRGAYGLGCEFFANAFSAHACNRKKTLEITRKLFPETMKCYDEILEKIKEHG